MTFATLYGGVLPPNSSRLTFTITKSQIILQVLSFSHILELLKEVTNPFRKRNILNVLQELLLDFFNDRLICFAL